MEHQVKFYVQSSWLSYALGMGVCPGGRGGWAGGKMWPPLRDSKVISSLRASISWAWSWTSWINRCRSRTSALRAPVNSVPCEKRTGLILEKCYQWSLVEYVPFYLSVCPSVWLSICVFARLCVRLSATPCVYLIYGWLSVYLTVCSSVCLVCLSLHVCILCSCLSVHLTVGLSVFLSVCISISMHIS